MICSMTGYAVREAKAGSVALSLELKSVNARFLDVAFRLPDTLRAAEMPLREKIAAKIRRGKLECRVTLEEENAAAIAGDLNEAALAALAELERRARAVLPNAAPLSARDALMFPGVLERAPESAAAALLLEAVFSLADTALDELVEVRAREGEKLARDILERAARLKDVVQAVKPLLPQAETEFLEKLRTRLRSAADAGATGENLDEKAEARLLQEVALMAARMDVAEELSRLSAHLEELSRLVASGGQVGKRLDFLLQEFNREANTLASKSALPAITRYALEMKLLIEQMREQTQNLE
ncbi:MAG: YicC family protein [Zoogloeaceae bacterium]|jgi:uncharacterized protein (TIGR00255 family)|nr:YicC family protein [Zoogloeaceae bacterium]